MEISGTTPVPVDFAHPVVVEDLAALDTALANAHAARDAGDHSAFRAALYEVGAALNLLVAPESEIEERHASQLAEEAAAEEATADA